MFVYVSWWVWGVCVCVLVGLSVCVCVLVGVGCLGGCLGGCGVFGWVWGVWVGVRCLCMWLGEVVFVCDLGGR